MKTALAWLLLCTALTRGTPAARLVYPAAPKGDVVDRYHGHDVPDPYRWLEDATSAQSAAWLAQEASLTSAELARLPGRERIRSRLDVHMRYRRPNVPWREAGKLYWTETREGDEQAVLCGADTPGGKAHVVFNPNQLSPDGSIEMGDFVVSPDGKYLAYRAARGGADAGEIRVHDLSTGTDTGDAVSGYNACWTRDSRGFFYARSFRSDSDPNARGGVRAFYHRRGDAPDSDRRVMEFDARAGWLYFMVSEDGRYAALVAEEGTVSEVYSVDLKAGHDAATVEILAGEETFYTPLDWVGHTFYLRSKLNAPRSRVIAVDLRDGAKATAREVIPESGDVITDAIITADRIVINYLSDVHSRLKVFTLDGSPAGEITLPGLGSVGWPLSARPSTPELFFSFDSFLSPASLRTCDVRALTTTVLQSSPVSFDAGKYETRQIFYASRDGTRVPMFVTAAKGVELDGSHPVFLTAYGGYGATMDPGFSPDVPLWLEMGGIYVLANIRGGGEYGEAWHEAGMLAQKQTSFDDFIAAADYLIANGYTRRGKIAIYGHSNGGLLMGAVLAQRPDLWGAVVANAGHYDMLRYHRFTAGASWVGEYGSADDASQFDYLRAYSPLQNVKSGTCYAPTLLLAADHDDRVVPAHAYKFAAALQTAQACDAPVLLRVAKDASHSYSSRQATIAERVDMWSFIAANLGVTP